MLFPIVTTKFIKISKLVFQKLQEFIFNVGAQKMRPQI